MLVQRIMRMFAKAKKVEGRLWRISLCYVFRLLKLSPHKIVFRNFGGNGYGDNPKYIAAEIIRQNLDYDLVWLLREDMMDKHSLPPQVRVVKENSWQEIYELMTATFWVDNLLKAPYIRKRKHQYYIQTSHGTPALKKFEDDSYVRDFKRIDLLVSNCAWYSSLARQSLGYRGEILECGSPRNDIFFKDNHAVEDKVRKRFGIEPAHKIVLYVPTWRSDLEPSTYELDMDLCLKALSERFVSDWVFMLRLHPNVPDQVSANFKDRRVVNATRYEDVQELLAVADVVITDYSSIMFDFAIRRLPVFLYTPDIDAYQRDVGFHFELNDIPFQVSRSNVELVQHIQDFNFVEYTKHVDFFFRSVGSFDRGKAARVVAGRISSYLVDGSSHNRLQSATLSGR